VDRQRDIKLKVTIIWLAILLLGSFWLTARAASEPVHLVVVPEVPREGEPIIATFNLNNSASQVMDTEYRLYANGELMTQGTATISPGCSKQYQYVYRNALELGEQVSFVIKTESALGSHMKVVSLPSYPPQVWSSFVSFASFSTSVMSSISSSAYYQRSFGLDMGLNVLVLITIVLVAGLIFMELTQFKGQERSIAVLGRLRIRLSTLTWILFIIFMAAVYTKVVIIIAI